MPKREREKISYTIYQRKSSSNKFCYLDLIHQFELIIKVLTSSMLISSSRSSDWLRNLIKWTFDLWRATWFHLKIVCSTWYRRKNHGMLLRLTPFQQRFGTMTRRTIICYPGTLCQFLDDKIRAQILFARHAACQNWLYLLTTSIFLNRSLLPRESRKPPEHLGKPLRSSPSPRPPYSLDTFR